MKIYTKTGDKGSTSLVGGKRVKKTDVRVEAYGTVDELMSNIAVLIAFIEDEKLQEELKKVQNCLMTIASHLATEDDEIRQKLPQIQEASIHFLEKQIDLMDEEIPELNSFILPGGNKTSSLCHVARSVCRRAERNSLRINQIDTTSPLAVKYLNRLSDYLFTLSRFLLQKNNIPETLWRP
ncbi:MAG: ATP:cob(I)alamin adenosyltransferase [Bacteroidetes bacterium HGW-Bacteroidetes-21]|jgi:cob(I)alamin adenosyltransferase|nr:MAG: ATP:cob(I)alamin adenosyltransferase [Bacteroidetes bacterium HGW-Bacteroidetes-21]